MRKVQEVFFSSNLFVAAFFALVFSACHNIDDGNSEELPDPAESDVEVFTKAKSARDYMNSDVKYGTLKDSRDGKKYRTVKMGDLTWMAENLNFADSTLFPNIAGNSWCYDNNPSYCDVGGRLYTWTAAVDAPPKYLSGKQFSTGLEYVEANFRRGICPEGWHVPSASEIYALLDQLGDDRVGSSLKASKGWRFNAGGDNSSGFTMLPVGRMKNGVSFNAGFEFSMWYDGEAWVNEASALVAEGDSDVGTRDFKKTLGLSVRCVQDTAEYVVYRVNDSTGMQLGDTNALSMFLDPATVEKGKFKDPRDGREYRTVKIGDQTWFAENLDYATDDAQEGVCLASLDSNCRKYGRLYTRWYAERYACPEGTHLPTETEFRILQKSVGRNDTVDWSGLALKSREGWNPVDNRWKSEGNGVDRYGFNALPAGAQTASDSAMNEGKQALFLANGSGYAFSLNSSDHRGTYIFVNERTPLASVRCLVGEKIVYHMCGEPQRKPALEFTGTDSSVSGDGYLQDLRDGKFYRIVTIGNQTWMAENLNFRPEAYSYDTKCYSDKSALCDTLGAYYTWDAAMDMRSMFSDAEDFFCKSPKNWRGLCPVGWHMPTRDEWEELLSTVGDRLSASRILKSTTGWADEKGTDNYGFSVIPAGGSSNGRDRMAYFWSATDWNSNGAFMYSFDGASYSTVKPNLVEKGGAYSVRCVRDSTLASEAVEIKKSDFGLVPPCKTEKKDNCEYGTVTDTRDGREYKTVKIGLQTWMAENLSFESGDIPADSLGMFYTWAAAMEGVCPKGFHLPSEKEWRQLIAVVGGDNSAKVALKSTTGWNLADGTDAYGFNVLPTGYWYPPDASVHNRSAVTHFWTSDGDNRYSTVKSASFGDDSEGDGVIRLVDKTNGVSVRCVGN